MRTLLTFVVCLFATGCAGSPSTAASAPTAGQTQFADTDDDGLPDTRVVDDAGSKTLDPTLFEDRDGDGLPDTHLPSGSGR